MRERECSALFGVACSSSSRLRSSLGLSFATPCQVGDLPGVIVMALQDGGKAAPELRILDPHTEQIVVVFNARCAIPGWAVALTGLRLNC